MPPPSRLLFVFILVIVSCNYATISLDVVADVDGASGDGDRGRQLVGGDYYADDLADDDDDTTGIDMEDAHDAASTRNIKPTPSASSIRNIKAKTSQVKPTAFLPKATINTSNTNAKTKVNTKTGKEIFQQALQRAIGGGIPGAVAGAVQVLSLMWLVRMIQLMFTVGDVQ